jgi:hypothetical protein
MESHFELLPGFVKLLRPISNTYPKPDHEQEREAPTEMTAPCGRRIPFEDVTSNSAPRQYGAGLASKIVQNQGHIAHGCSQALAEQHNCKRSRPPIMDAGRKIQRQTALFGSPPL